MSTPLYVFKAHRISVANLVQFHIVNYQPEKFYKNCTYSNQGKLLFSVDGEAVKEIAQITNDTPIRYTDWNSHIDLLSSYVDQAKQHNQIMMFANHDINQVQLLKNHFDDSMTMVCINYRENLYQYLLKNMAQYHVYLLQNNLLIPSDTDREILNNIDSAIEYYQESFDQHNLIPKSSIHQGDYNIWIDDFFDINLMETHFNNLGFPLDNHRPGLYHSWLDAIHQDQDFPS